MKQITKKAYAKINLSLDVLRKREDGYHEVSMVMHQIDLYDEVTITIDSGETECGETGDGSLSHKITLSTNNTLIPTDEKNIAYKAAKAMLEEYDKRRGNAQGSDPSHITPMDIHIHIEKNIPVSAGLAGGSTNAAAVISGLNELLSLELESTRLMEIGKKLGADVPFCLLGGCALAEGIGEKLTPLPAISQKILLSKPAIEVSTAAVYGGLKIAEIPNHPNTKELINDLKEASRFKCNSELCSSVQHENDLTQNIFLKKMYKNMNNVLENVTLKEYPIVMYTKDMMANTGADLVLMSGSGPTVFAIYAEDDTLNNAYEQMKKINSETYITSTIAFR